MYARLIVLSLSAIVATGSNAAAFKLGGPGGTCPKDTRVQCAVNCDDGEVADYMKWTGAGWSDLVGKIKDPDMNAEARKLVDHSNQQMTMLGAKATCK